MTNRIKRPRKVTVHSWVAAEPFFPRLLRLNQYMLYRPKCDKKSSRSLYGAYTTQYCVPTTHPAQYNLGANPCTFQYDNKHIDRAICARGTPKLDCRGRTENHTDPHGDASRFPYTRAQRLRTRQARAARAVHKDRARKHPHTVQNESVITKILRLSSISTRIPKSARRAAEWK